MTARIEKGEGAIGRLMAADDPLYADLSATVASLKALSQRLEKGEGTVGRLLSSDDTLYRDLSASAASLRTISAKIEKGEGTLGRLVNDDAVYGRLDETLSEVRNAIEDFRETSPVTTFTSIFFGAF
jgi:phospholipid/cholesterol/gamma-HCH transport system substrate-binding protein